MRWIIFLFVFLLPLYIFRLPILVAGAITQIPFLELAAYLIAIVVLCRDARKNFYTIKIFFSENKLLLAGIILLWTGLIIGIFQSNDTLVSLGIVRGWFFAPCLWFLVLVVLKERGLLDSSILLAFASSAGAVSVVALLFPHFNQDARMRGIYDSPNYLAMYVAPLIPIVAYQAYRAHRKFVDTVPVVEYLKKYVWFFVLGLCLAVIFFSLSFGSWLGLAAAISGALSLWAFRFCRKLFLAAVSPCIPIVILVLVLFYARIIEKIHSRLGLWYAAWKLAVAHPLFGIGEGMFQTAYQLQKHLIPYPVPLESALHPHNIFFTFWLYGGVLGLAGFFCILFWIGQKIYRKLKKTPADFLALAVACSFIIILAHGLVDTTYWKNDLAFMWWTLAGLLT